MPARSRTLQQFLILFLLFPCCALAQQTAPDLSGLRWRMIGPFRGGRSIAVSGVEGDPNTYYFGGVGGGVWKTTNGGMTWMPIFDGQPIASIGAIAVAASDPNIIYVGTGEADFRSNLTYGNGVYKSTDAGKSWTNIGLRETQHISRIVVDPHNASIVLVAAMGHAYGPNPDRGVFRSTDGGATWQKVLYKDQNTGAIDIQLDPDNSQTVIAALERLPSDQRFRSNLQIERWRRDLVANHWRRFAADRMGTRGTCHRPRLSRPPHLRAD